MKHFSKTLTIAAQRRALIDFIATGRARAIRVAMFGNMIFRPNPHEADTQDEISAWYAAMHEQITGLERATTIMRTGRDPEGTLPAEICAWIGRRGAAHGATDTMARMATMSKAIETALKKGDAGATKAALSEHLQFGRTQFFEDVTGFCDTLWADLDATRLKEVEAANAKAEAISKTLSRLEKIGKHVRLVSLNASVEAARVGDEGRGLGVIAAEFKTLAEEIQLLSTTARADIFAMTDHDETA